MKYLNFWDDIAQEVLEHITQEQVFYYVFNCYPDIRKRYCSPYRVDSRPDCFFYYHSSGKLLFTDKAGGITHNCFEAIAYKYKLQTIKEVSQLLSTFDVSDIKSTFVKPEVVETIIKTKSSSVTEEDLQFWGPYGITLEQLRTDNIRRVKEALIIKGIKKTHIIYDDTLNYLIYSLNGRKKIYSPYSDLKFLSNTKVDDVLKTCNTDLDSLVISKSYKDYRVLANQGVNCIWLQSETMFPTEQFLAKISSYFKKIVALFDNDEAGIRQSKILASKIDVFYPGKTRPLHLPVGLCSKGITDPSDLYKEKGKQELINFLKESNIETYRNIP